MKKDSLEPSDSALEPFLANEKPYRQLFDEAIEGICLADAKTGIILDCNKAFLLLMEYERSELVGQSHTILHRQEEVTSSASTFAAHCSDQNGKILNTFLVTKSGTVFEAEIKASLIDIGGRKILYGFIRNLTEELRGRRERETTLALMRLLNDRNHTHQLIGNLTEFLQRWSGCEAVGVRLREGDDFPYFETRGFPSEFVQVENHLCQHDLNGQILRDGWGNPVLECMCGNVLSRRFDPSLPFFTEKGSFWTNCTTELLAKTTESQRQARTRNRCNGEGFESVAIIPLRHGQEVIGLLQLNDHARGRFTLDLISFLENTADQIAIALAQRQTQAALEASEERYRRLFEVESDAILLVEIETQSLIDANRAALELYGYTREEFLRLKTADVSAEPEKTRVAILSSEKHIPLRWHRKKDGTVFPVEVTGSYFDYRGRRVHVAAIRDISKRKQAEEALRESEARFRGYFEMGLIGMVITSPEKGILQINECFCDMLGYRREEMMRLTWAEITHPDDLAADVAQFNRLLVGEIEGYAIEKRFTHKNGLPVYTHISVRGIRNPGGGVDHLVAFVQDITERKLAETLLRESEERYRSLFEHLTEGYAYCRMLFESGVPQDWLYLSVNEAFETLTGLKDVVGKTVCKVIPGIRQSNPQLFEIFGRVSLTGEPEKFEIFVEALSAWFSISVYSPEKHYFVSILDVITERKQAESAIRKSEALFSKAFHGSPAAMIISSRQDDRIIDVNESFERQSGYARKEILGRTAQEIGLMSDPLESQRMSQQLAAEGFIHNFECAYRTHSGEQRLARYSVEIVEIGGESCLLTVGDDITERKRMAEALKASEERFRRMFNHMSNGLIVYEALGDGEDFLIKEYNPAAERIGKVSRAEVVGRRVSQAFPALKDIGLFQAFQRVWRTGLPERHPASFYSDGRFSVWVENYVFKLPTGEIVAIFDDLTEQIQAQERVEAFRTELTHASRLATVGALAAGIAHEINQPLSIIATWAEVASREIRDKLAGDKQEALLALMRIDTAIERSGDIIQHMKDFAKKSESRVSPVSLAAAIEDVLLFLDHQLRISGVTLSVELNQDLPAVLVDRTQIQQVLMNLFLNAVEAMEQIERQARRIEVRAKIAGGMLETAVCDSGCSIPADQLDSIFDAFHSTKPKGMGLGLSICRTIIQWHGGKIWAARNADRGTTITFTLPVTKEKSRHATEIHHLYRR